MLVAMEDLALKLEWQLSDCEVRGLIAIGEPLNNSPRPRTSDLFENDDECYHWHTYYLAGAFLFCSARYEFVRVRKRWQIDKTYILSKTKKGRKGNVRMLKLFHYSCSRGEYNSFR